MSRGERKNKHIHIRALIIYVHKALFWPRTREEDSYLMCHAVGLNPKCGCEINFITPHYQTHTCTCTHSCPDYSEILLHNIIHGNHQT